MGGDARSEGGVGGGTIAQELDYAGLGAVVDKLHRLNKYTEDKKAWMVVYDFESMYT